MLWVPGPSTSSNVKKLSHALKGLFDKKHCQQTSKKQRQLEKIQGRLL